MKTVSFCVVSMLFAVAVPMASSHAQTCVTPADWHPGSEGRVPLTGTTCGHEAGIVSVCQGAGGAPGAAYVSLINVDDLGTYTSINFTGGSGYTLSAYLVPQASGCNADAACTTVGDGSTPMQHSDVPPGVFYLIVTGADFDFPGACGTFSITSNGSLPVSLAGFSID